MAERLGKSVRQVRYLIQNGALRAAYGSGSGLILAENVLPCIVGIIANGRQLFQ